VLRTQGLPKQTFGSIVILLSSSSCLMSATQSCLSLDLLEENCVDLIFNIAHRYSTSQHINILSRDSRHPAPITAPRMTAKAILILAQAHNHAGSMACCPSKKFKKPCVNHMIMKCVGLTPVFSVTK
jgi:hypothetical protein